MMYNDMNDSDDERKANVFCIASLICVFLPRVLQFLGYLLFGTLLQQVGRESVLYDRISGALSALGIVFLIAGIVLVIYVRVKYPKNIFGKVLMWIYIVLAVLILIAFIVMLVACTLACSYLIETCQGCASMG
ncbi:MAG: hypothetical protein ACI4E2_07180 [Acetatifactor sp.]